MVCIDDGGLDQRHGRVAAAHAEQPDLRELPIQQETKHFPDASLLRFRPLQEQEPSEGVDHDQDH